MAFANKSPIFLNIPQAKAWGFGWKSDKTFKQLFPFDLGNWENTSQYISPHTDDVANAIENVASKLENLRRTRSGTGNLRDIGQSILSQNDPQTKALKRIADALERMSSDE